jgi:hypothetical protein
MRWPERFVDLGYRSASKGLCRPDLARDSPITDLAATQAALLLDKLRREHKQRRHG